MILESNESNNQRIKTKEILIEKNSIQFNRTTLQISSIAQISLHTPPGKSMTKPVVAFIICLFLIKSFTVVSILGLVISGAIIYQIKKTNDSRGEDMYIHLNSGNRYIIACAEPQFADHIREVIEYCINNSNSERIVINMDQCDISNSPIMFGSNNGVEYGN